MLRSFNYAAVASVRGVAMDRTSDGTNRLLRFARDWERRTAAAFLEGYRARIAGCRSYPADPETAQRLLDLFVLEKAFYEMQYELRNRPSWLEIPLHGIREILDRREAAVIA
jgi:maltose alpha-D-glucosyltransferase/alpha-amylase